MTRSDGFGLKGTSSHFKINRPINATVGAGPPLRDLSFAVARGHSREFNLPCSLRPSAFS